VENWPTLDRLARKFHGLPDDCYRIKSKDEIKTQMKRISTADHLARVFDLDNRELRFRAIGFFNEADTLESRNQCYETFLSVINELV
jgi:hypothetical protein